MIATSILLPATAVLCGSATDVTSLAQSSIACKLRSHICTGNTIQLGDPDDTTILDGIRCKAAAAVVTYRGSHMRCYRTRISYLCSGGRYPAPMQVLYILDEKYGNSTGGHVQLVVKDGEQITAGLQAQPVLHYFMSQP